MSRGVQVNVCLATLAFALMTFSTQAQVSFFQPVTLAGYGSSFVADFNGDGKLDILQSNGTMNLGNGDGTFNPGIAVSGTVLAVADFNGDNQPDVLEEGTGSLLVLLGNGDGTFQAPISSPSGASLTALVAGDLNGDGRADVVGVSSSSLMVYLSNGDGTLAVPVSYNVGSLGATLLVLGNFSGHIDVALNVAGNELVFVGKGDGTFQATPETSVAVSADNVAAGDFNGDGKLDLAMSSSTGVYILSGKGDGTFQAPVSAFSGDGFLVAADLRGNGKTDLLLIPVSNMPVPATCRVYLGNGDGTFSGPANYGISLSSSSSNLVVADFNGDGKLDVASTGVLLGNGDGTFHGISLGAAPEMPSAAVLGDFEKNGTPDVALIPSTTGSGVNLYILSGDGAAGLSLLHTYALPQAETAITTADVNQDGKLDLIFLGTDPTTKNWSFSVMLGNGDGSFQSPVDHIQSGTVLTSFIVADFNNDHVPDLAFGGSGSDQLAVMLGNGDGTFKSPAYYFDNGSYGLLAADFNNDGNQDIAVSSNGGTGLLFGKGDGTFQTAVFPSSLSNFSPRFTADLNSDGKPDLVAANQVALGNGDGTFSLLPAFVPTGYWTFEVSAIGDVDGDGIPDIVGWAGFGHPAVTAILPGNGDGTFGVIPLSGGVLSDTPLLIADMNGDKRPDLVFPWADFTGECGAPGLCNGIPPGVAVLVNTTPPGFKLVASAPSPATVVAGNSATSTVTVIPTFQFNGSVNLSCTGLASGIRCAFNPPSMANASGNAALTITTTASVAAATYSIQISGTAGTVTNIDTLWLEVQAVPDFSFSPASGSASSQTINAGQSANFSLDLTASGGFSGTVSFTCAITPVVSPAPTCQLPSSVQVTGTGVQSVSVSVVTTASTTGSVVPRSGFPPLGLRLTWCALVLSLAALGMQNRRRRLVLSLCTGILLTIWLPACGGSSSSSHTGGGTPAGTYTATVTAASGNLSHNTVLQVIVQ